MGFLQHFGQLYSLETLDTRFTSSAKSRAADNAQEKLLKDQSSANHLKSSLQPTDTATTRWRTPEFSLYGLVFAVVVPLMFYTVYDVSQSWNPQYEKFEPLLSNGWIPGRKVDNSDSQYSNFRDNLPYLFLLVVAHPLLRKVLAAFQPTTKSSPAEKSSLSTNQGSDNRSDRRSFRITFDLYFGIVFLFALHGTSAPKVLLILAANYAISSRVPRRWMTLATWAFNVGILFSNELAHGYRYASMMRPLNHSQGSGDSTTHNLGQILDSYGGLIPRWEVLFKVSILRLISFNMDRMWALDRAGSSSPIEKKQLDSSHLSDRDRVSISANLSEYSFRNYLAYTLYSPLYLAGPILTFNDYVAQQTYQAQSITFSRTLRYGIRFIIALLTMEIMTHYIYVVAISKADPAWNLYSPLQLSMIGYFNLHHIWLKLLLPWRFFRLWALIDGIDPPENMVRCMSDNYSAFAFWRGWHRSYNRWVVRYIYIPLGGSGTSSNKGIRGSLNGIANMFLVFTFVAIWHDIQLHLLIWGWLVTLFVLPELVASLLFPKSQWQDRPNTYRVLCGIGAVGNILMMMSAHLVGFAVGIDGLKDLVVGIIGSVVGVIFFATACCCLFVGVQVMFELRQNELQKGINMKC